MAPVIAEITGDGDMEIIAVGDDGWVHALRGANSSTLRSRETTAYQCSPAVGNIDGDGTLEVVVAGGRVEILNGTNGETRWTYGSGHSTQGYWVTLADLDSDGNVEIIWSTDDGWTHAIKNSTTTLWSREDGIWGGYMQGLALAILIQMVVWKLLARKAIVSSL